MFKLLFAGKSALFYNGQFFSDEPGLYIEGEFGIRLETVLRWVLTFILYIYALSDCPSIGNTLTLDEHEAGIH